MSNLKLMKTNGMMGFELNKGYSNRTNTKKLTFSPCYNVPMSKINLNHKANQIRVVTKNTNHLEDMKASILGKGLTNPIVLSVDKNGVISVESGHHRYDIYGQLGEPTIPAYFVTYNGFTQKEVDLIRQNFLEEDNEHDPVLQPTMKDAEKSLFKYKDLGVFDELDDGEVRKKATRMIKKRYSHFGVAKVKTVVSNFMKGCTPVSYRTYTLKDRKEVAKKYKYTVKPNDFDYNHCAYYANAQLGNCLKSVATIDKYSTLPAGIDAADVSIHVFCNTGSKDLASSKARRKEFLAQMVIGNTNYSRYQVGKIFFLPDLVSQNECEIYDWTVNDEGVGSFIKQ
jgi:hypothetical protein